MNLYEDLGYGIPVHSEPYRKIEAPSRSRLMNHSARTPNCSKIGKDTLTQIKERLNAASKDTEDRR